MDSNEWKSRSTGSVSFNTEVNLESMPATFKIQLMPPEEATPEGKMDSLALINIRVPIESMMFLHHTYIGSHLPFLLRRQWW